VPKILGARIEEFRKDTSYGLRIYFNHSYASCEIFRPSNGDHSVAIKAFEEQHKVKKTKWRQVA
jgi:hypothetical protein